MRFACLGDLLFSLFRGGVAMKSFLMLLALACGVAGQVFAEDVKQKEENPPVSAAEKLKANPDDSTALIAYINQEMKFVTSHMQKDPDAAGKKLQEIIDFLGSLEATVPTAKTNISRYQGLLRSYNSQIELARIKLPDLLAKLDADPSDAETLSLYIRKVVQTVGPQARTEPEKAEPVVTAARQRVQKAIDAAVDEAAKKRLESQLNVLASLERSIEAGKKLVELIGKDAAPLEVDAWVNGSPLTDADLKGKVVMLDFWAIWCGPCIATFPHLREWQEHYADKGLVIIGLTRYYNYTWDEDASRATRAKETIEPEAEHRMLEQFAAHHKLKHRFALQKESTLSEFYGVTGIPHCVVIDQQGKVRLMRVGSGEQNAKDISEMLEKLLGPPAAAGASE
jgi:thiol-disulfide isomerase/thioredoxin